MQYAVNLVLVIRAFFLGSGWTMLNKCCHLASGIDMLSMKFSTIT